MQRVRYVYIDDYHTKLSLELMQIVKQDISTLLALQWHPSFDVKSGVVMPGFPLKPGLRGYSTYGLFR